MAIAITSTYRRIGTFRYQDEEDCWLLYETTTSKLDAVALCMMILKSVHSRSYEAMTWTKLISFLPSSVIKLGIS